MNGGGNQTRGQTQANQQTPGQGRAPSLRQEGFICRMCTWKLEKEIIRDSIPQQNPAPDLYHVPDPISPTHDTFRRGKLPSHNGHKIDALDDAMPPGAAAWQGWQHAPFYCGTLHM